MVLICLVFPYPVSLLFIAGMFCPQVPQPGKASSLSPSGQAAVCLQLEDRDKTAKRLVSLDAFRG